MQNDLDPPVLEEDEDDEDAYLLDLEEDVGADVDALTREALEAVDRVERESGEHRIHPPQVPNADEATGEEPSIGQLEAELAELRDRSVRTLADFENFRRRVAREKDELRRYAAFEVLQSFLPVLDNLQRALASEGSRDDLKLGVEMIQRQLLDLFRQNGVVEIEALGQPFDPRFHEAVSREEDLSLTVPIVAEELQRGYRLHERLLRAAMVKVAMPPEAPEPEAADEEN